MALTGCTTTADRAEWPYAERVEDVVNDVLRDACPPWSVSITSQSRSMWVVVAKPHGDAAYSALLTPGLHTPGHVRQLITEFYEQSQFGR